MKEMQKNPGDGLRGGGLVPSRQGKSTAFRDPIIIAAIVASVALAAVYVFPVLSTSQFDFVTGMLSLLPFLILGMLAPWYRFPPMANNEERRFWALWTTGLGFILIVRVIYLVNPDVDSLVSGAISIDTLYVFFYLALILSLRVRPDRHAFHQERSGLRRTEAIGTAVFVLALLAYFTLVPNTLSPEEYATWIPSLLMYWVLDAFLFLTLVYLRYTSVSREWRILYTWLALAPLCWATTEILEILFYLEWQGPEWTSAGFLDALWYLPWLFIIVAARVRTRPVPAVFGGSLHQPDEHREVESLGRPGALLIMCLTLPVVHFASNLLDLLDPATRDMRESVVLITVAVLLGLAFLHQKILERKTLALARRSWELEQQQRLLATALEQAPEPILIADASGRVEYANPAFRGVDVGHGDLMGRHLKDVIPDSASAVTGTSLDQALQEGELWEGRIRSTSGEGETREELVTVSPLRSGDGKVENWAVLRKDVTYLTQLEQKFRQAQKMEALGTLAGGIAHDFNNILAAIYGYAEVIKGDLDPDSSSRQHLTGLTTAAERARDLVKQILTFSRLEEDDQELFELLPTVKEAVSLLRATLPSTIEIRDELASDVGFMSGRRQQIQQIILNLGTNASHAMGDDGGSLVIGLSRTPPPLDEERLENATAAGDFALISVTDSGVGMDESTLGRMFDPFFTTKDVGKGTGLGLSVVHGIVASHGGIIRVSSVVGKGTTFNVCLPIIETATEATPPSQASEPSETGGRLLVVDDEPMLVELAQKMLAALGYEVVAFNSSTDALAALRSSPDGIDALVTDQTMPGMTGLELAAAAREIRPNLPILLTSGFSESLTPDRMVDAPVNQILAKPYSRADLGQAVADVLSVQAND